jgi:transcriptional regulator with XRE-family HTH domain
MIYNKIDKLRKKQKSQKILADAVGMTVQGLNLMLNKRTMTVDTLEKIAKYFEVSPAYFFEEESNLVGESKHSYKQKCIDCSKYEGQIELLSKLLREKDDMIARLNREIGSNKTVN